MLHLRSIARQTPVIVSLTREFAEYVSKIVPSKHLTDDSDLIVCKQVQSLAALAKLEAQSHLQGINYFFKRSVGISSSLKAQRGWRSTYADLVKNVDEQQIEKVHDIAKVEGHYIYLVSLKNEPVWEKCWVERIPEEALDSLRANR